MRLLVTSIGLLVFVLAACSDSVPPPETISTPTIAETADQAPSPESPPTRESTASPEPPPTAEPTATKTAVDTVTEPVIFDGELAYEILLDQMEFGPRWPGSPGHTMVVDYIFDVLENQGWETEEQTFTYQGLEGRNIIGRTNIGAGPVIILGAHYDTRKIADQTAGSTDSVPGAVDGASGVAVLLELARSLEVDEIENEIWLAFFDVEDQGSGGMPGFDYIVGSTYMAGNMTLTPQAMVLVDMIGDADQQLYYEGNSDPALRGILWQIAAELGYGDTFVRERRHVMLDDHIPFVNLGIPAVDIIDFDYPYWHTIEDTADKASADSLERVGRTLEVWLEDKLTG